MAEIMILGAGMVGVSTALAFQAQGHSVILVDRRPPGQETSFGNAGIIQAEAVEPYALPRDPVVLFRMLSGISNDLTWSMPGALLMLPALMSYFRNSSPRRHREISRTYAQLAARSTVDHAPLIEASGQQNLIRHDGLSILHRNARDYDAACRDAARIRDSYGLEFRAVDGAAYRQEDPALKKAPAGVIHWLDSWSCASPGGLVTAYADLFRKRGGTIMTGNADSLTPAEKGWRVQTESGAVTAQDAVVALGPWSPDLLKRFGYRIPMIWKRGYHGHYKCVTPPVRPFMDASLGIVASGMVAGLRITTGAAVVTRDSPPDLRQLERGRRGLSDLLEIGPRVEEPQWFGARPCLPDMLPMVGPAPRHKGLWFNFGHGHQGFTLGPTTADILARQHAGDGVGAFGALLPEGRL